MLTTTSNTESPFHQRRRSVWPRRARIGLGGPPSDYIARQISSRRGVDKIESLSANLQIMGANYWWCVGCGALSALPCIGLLCVQVMMVLCFVGVEECHCNSPNGSNGCLVLVAVVGILLLFALAGFAYTAIALWRQQRHVV